MAVALRNTGIQASSASSYNVPWPSGTVAGDTAVIFFGHGFALNSLPSGWTQLDVLSGSNWNGATIFKVLNSADITAGSVTINAAGGFDGTVAIATIDGTTIGGFPYPISSSRNGSGSSSVTLNLTATSLNDLNLYFGSNRANSTNTVSIGSLQQQVTDGSAASGCLYSETPPSLSRSPQFNYSSAGSGNFQSALCAPAPQTVPSWIRGTGIQASSAGSYVVPWPSGTAAGDTALIFVGAGWSASTPSGWTLLDSQVAGSWNGFAFTKILDSTDISNGSVTITMSNTFDSTVAIATIKSASLTGYGSPVLTSARTNGVASQAVGYTAGDVADFVVCFGSARSNCVATVDTGSNLRQVTDAANASGCIFAGNPPSTGSLNATFFYKGGGTAGDYEAAVVFAAPAVSGLDLFAKGFAASSARAGLTGELSLSAQGAASGRGRAGPNNVFQLMARGFAAAFGKGLSVLPMPLSSKGRAGASGKAGILTLFVPLKGRGTASSTGKTRFRAFGERVITFTSYWSRRNP